MRRLLSVGLLLGWLSGCLGARPLTEPMGPPVPIYSDNPLLIPLADPQMVWEGVVDVVDDYFKIEREEPVRLFGDTLTEGRLDTFHEVGTTWLEPWRYDSADGYERLESTLQSIRRRAQVRVIPAQGGFLLDVAVYKELEDVKRPAHASAGAATFRTEGSLTRVVSPIGEQEVNKGWIALGRDRALEQRILSHVQQRLRVTGLAPSAPLAPAVQPDAPRSQPDLLPSPPGTPSSPANCRFGASNATSAPREHVTYRFDLPDELPAWLPGEPDWPGCSDPGVEGRAPEIGFAPTFETGPPAGSGDPCLWLPPTLDREIGPDPQRSEDMTQPWSGLWRSELRPFLSDMGSDYGLLYSRRGLLLLSVGVGGAAVLANTSLDEHFRQWHDEHVFTHDLSRFAYVVKEFGDGRYWAPFYVLCALAGRLHEPSPGWDAVGQWGDRSLRAFLLGGPPVLVLQWVLGASRPDESIGSHWRPFQDINSVSGHAFIGGISFLSAAMMTDNLALKSALYAASILPAWARVIQDKHYLSQALLGWWIAYLSASAVDWTEQSKSAWLVTPVLMDGGVGVCCVRSW